MKLGKDVTAIVTGGASGLGQGVARALSELGVHITLFDLDEEGGSACAEEIGAKFVHVDVSDAESVADGFAKARKQQGQEAILAHCAGIAPAAKTVSRGAVHDPKLFEKILRVNLLGSFLCASHAALGMREAKTQTEEGERGVIILTASVAAFDGQIGQVAYAASKGGVAGMTLPMARDLASLGIRVVTLAPGIFDTPMLQAMPEGVRQSLAAQVPFPSRLGRPSDYASLVLEICRNEMLNGEIIRLDGAIRMSPR